MQISRIIAKSSLFAAVAGLSLGFAGIAKAGSIPIYATGFENSTGSALNPVAYNTGNLVGQDSWTGPLSFGFASPTATVQTGTVHNGSQAVDLKGGGDGVHFDAVDYYSTNSALTTSQINSYGNEVVVSWDMNRSILGGRGSTQDYGIDILSANRDAVLASVYLGLSSDPTPIPDLQVTNGTNGPSGSSQEPDTSAGYGRPAGEWDTYTADLNFKNNTYTVAIDGVQVGGTYSLATDIIGAEGNGIGAIAFAAFNPGTSDHAFFDNLTVVPEPASVGLIALGSLLVICRRPARA